MKSYMLYYPLSGYQKSRYNPGKRLAGESKEIKQKWKGQKTLISIAIVYLVKFNTNNKRHFLC